MMDYVFDPAAAEELETAVEYYNMQQVDLGRKFLNEVTRVIGHIHSFPEASPSITPRSRRCRTRRFPYGVVYQIIDGRIRILAVMHLYRRADYWKDREQ